MFRRGITALEATSRLLAQDSPIHLSERWAQEGILHVDFAGLRPGEPRLREKYSAPSGIKAILEC